MRPSGSPAEDLDESEYMLFQAMGGWNNPLFKFVESGQLGKKIDKTRALYTTS